jgi:hypothetical protein
MNSADANGNQRRGTESEGNLTEGSSLNSAQAKLGPAIEIDNQENKIESRFPRFIHYCSFVIIRRTLKNEDSKLAWVERCRCGRVVICDSSFNVGSANIPRLTKHWYDREGNYLKTTGHNTIDYPKIIDTKSLTQAE